jgi:hypothetical protein
VVPGAGGRSNHHSTATIARITNMRIGMGASCRRENRSRAARS